MGAVERNPLASSRQRSPSPTLALHEHRSKARESIARMSGMGLHVFHPDWQGPLPSFSTSFKTLKMKLLRGGEEISIPVQTCTKVQDVQEALAQALFVEPEQITLLEKRGCTTRKQLGCEEVASTVTVKGIESFTPECHRWPHPTGIIGCGYQGIKTAIMYAKSGDHNFVVFDRNTQVGGYCWISAANRYSKLQTEIGSFHVWWGQDLLKDNCRYPSGWNTWAGKKEVLQHFQYAAERYGILPHVHLGSDVAELDVVGDKNQEARFYRLTVTPACEGRALTEFERATMGERRVNVSVLYNYPGSMTRNRIIDYPGEDVFGGYIAYGMNDDCPYSELSGKNVAILGNGAFAVENARTCAEHAVNTTYLLTRRKNLASPRVPCWFVHQGPMPTPGKLVLDMFKPMYELADFGDPWDYWSVHANSDRSKATIIQNSRFGIGDITFLMVIYGKLEYVQDTLKRLSCETMHLNSGRKIEDVHVILKSLGLLGDFAVDRLHKMKKMVGVFCDGDWRRPLMIDGVGMNAANFSTFTVAAGMGATVFVRSMKFLFDHPREFYRLQDLGLLKQLPTNKADEHADKPAYIFDVKYTQASQLTLESMCSKIPELSATDAEYQHRMFHTVHPTDKYLQECKEDWDRYQKMFVLQGCDHAYVAYPYTKDMLEAFCRDYVRLTGAQIDVDGPQGDLPQLQVCKPGKVGDLPDWARDSRRLEDLERDLAADKSWWWQASGNAAEDAAPQWMKTPWRKN